jgi:hypothetical protein
MTRQKRALGRRCLRCTLPSCSRGLRRDRLIRIVGSWGVTFEGDQSRTAPRRFHGGSAHKHERGNNVNHPTQEDHLISSLRDAPKGHLPCRCPPILLLATAALLSVPSTIAFTRFATLVFELAAATQATAIAIALRLLNESGLRLRCCS